MKSIRKKTMILLAILVALGGMPVWTMPGIGQAAAAVTGLWEPVGNAGLSAGESINTDLFVTADGTPYVAYKDGTNSYKAVVKKYNGSSWETVGNSGFSSGEANNIQIQVDNGTPYVLYSDAGQSGRIVVMKFDGTAWVPVGGGPLTSVSSAFFYDLSMYVYKGTPYVAFPDPANQLKGTMMRFNGSGWETLGGFYTTTTVSSLSLYVYEGTPYLGYQRGFGGNKANVIKFNGSSWETVGNVDLSGGASDYLSLYVDAGTPYLAYQDSNSGKRITVKKLDGGAWQPVGNAGFSAGTSTHTSLFVYGGTPYVAYKNYNDNGVMIMKYTGSAWELLGGGVAGSGTYPSLYVYDGVPYVAYQDYGLSSKATVKKLKKTVSYDGNGSTSGTVPAGTIGYDKNAIVTVLGNSGNLSKPGYDFAGWNTAEDGSGTPYAVGAKFAMGEDALTLYAQWTIGNYPVTYDGNGSNGGSVPAKVNHDYNSKVIVQGNTGNLTRTGYEFTGWNTAADGSGTPYGAGAEFTMGTQGVTLYAQWNIVSYSVAYDGNGSDGGSVPAESKHDYGTIVTVQGNTGALVRTGHTFVGWNTEANGSGTSYGENDKFPMGAANVRLYAQWTIDSYPVTYDGNGSNGGSVPAKVNHDYNSKVTVQGNTGNLIRTGYSFAGWNTEANGSGTSYGAGAQFTMGTQGVTLYAQWNIVSYSVAYDGNGSDGGSVPAVSNHNYGTIVNVQGNTGALVRTGHTFVGWNTEANGSGTPYGTGATFAMDAANVTLYAQWTIDSYPVTYDGNGSSGGSVPAKVNHDFNSKVTVQGNTGNLTRTGYSFAGWNTEANGSGTSYGAGAQFTMGTQGVTLYAQWTIVSYSVAYDGNGSDGGSVPAVSNHNYGTSVTVQGNTGTLVRKGHKFEGWNTEANGSGASYGENDTFPMGAANVTLYAQWTANSYAIAYDGNGNEGGNAPAGSSHVYETEVVVPGNTGDLTMTGYSFAGWNTAADGQGTFYGAGTTFFMDAADMTLYAAWTINSYPVVYEGNGSTGGSTPVDGSHDYQSAVTVLSNGTLVKAGHTFVGWNTEPDGSGTAYLEGDAFTIGASGVTLYAQWSINSYEVLFDSDGGTAVDRQTVVYGNPALEPTDPEKTGYTFDGWFTDAGFGSEFSFATAIEGNTTLYAKWKINSYTVAYDGNGNTGGAAPAGSSYDFESNVVVPGNPGNMEKTGHTFAGWNTAPDGSGTDYAEGATFTIGAAGVTLYAKWTVNSYALAFDGNGNTGGSAPVGGSFDYGFVVGVPDNTGGLDKTGYTFAGWNTEADGSGKAYRPGETFVMGDGAITLYAQWLSNNALLSFLSADSFDLSPTFSPTILNYEVNLDYSETALNLSFSPADPTQRVSVTGAVYQSVTGAVYQSVTGAVYHYQATGLSAGPNPIRIDVTAQDGTVNAYTVNVIRDPGNNADLSGLALSVGSLSPAFASGVTSYSANVPNGTSTLTVTSTATDPLASIAVNGHPVIGGQPSTAIPLSVGNNAVSVEVTARDGTKKTYTITVYRASSGGGGPVLPPAAGGTMSTNGQLTLPAGQKGEVSLGESIKVSIPAGATRDELKVSIAERTNAPLPPGSDPIGPILWIDSSATEPFLKPVTISLAFDPVKLKSGQDAAVYVYDEATGTWTKIEGGKIAGNRISVDVDRLRPIVVMAVDQATKPPEGEKPDPSFRDIGGHWAKATIERAAAAGIVSGYPDGTFGPNRTVTRAEFAVLLSKALQPSGTGVTLAFADQAKIGAWARQAVARAVQAGWIKGYKDGSFRPNAEITRVEMAAMIANAMGTLPDSGAASGFADDKAIPKWAKGAAKAVREAGLIQGKGSGEFDPLGKTTRAEAVTVIMNLLDWQRRE